ncbi:hypothetical protein CMO96_03550 [Candidatus Woesebacteria bacterium]|nr:hypothetical protein [Candidatus Woesebacteria bacterium]
MPKVRTSRSSASNNLFLLILPVAILFAGFIVWHTTQDVEGELAYSGCTIQEFSGLFQEGEKTAFFEGEEIDVPSQIPSSLKAESDSSFVLGVASGEERWIEVDLSDQKLMAREGDKVLLTTSISSGLPHTPTPTGEFRIWSKFRATKMEGGEGSYYYYLPNVPYVMFFENAEIAGMRGYSLHGTYWHEDFGTQRSHGCVNLPTPMAEKLYYWANPVTPEGTNMIRASGDNPGTRVVIHE